MINKNNIVWIGWRYRFLPFAGQELSGFKTRRISSQKDFIVFWHKSKRLAPIGENQKALIGACFFYYNVATLQAIRGWSRLRST